VAGAASQFTEIRAGHKDANGNFVNPTVVINGGADTISDRSQVPPRDTALAATADAIAGQYLFRATGCSTCHVQTLVTDHPGAVINGGAYTVPEALGNKIIHPYGDFLLHDVGTGDGIIQAGPQDTANKLRTVPLWGLHIESRFMHDNASLTLFDAIQRHAGEAQQVTSRFNGLTPQQQQQLITFLRCL
jgi:CxxC motif-containing protein (DUF1111 family)